MESALIHRSENVSVRKGIQYERLKWKISIENLFAKVPAACQCLSSLFGFLLLEIENPTKK